MCLFAENNSILRQTGSYRIQGAAAEDTDTAANEAANTAYTSEKRAFAPGISRGFSPLRKKQPPEGKFRKSMCLLISAILGILYSVYLITYFSGAVSGSEGAAALGAGIAVTLVMPHIAATVLATVFTTLGWGANSRGLALTGAILYCVAAVLFPLYAMFVLVQIILAFVGFTRLKTLRMQ